MARPQTLGPFVGVVVRGRRLMVAAVPDSKYVYDVLLVGRGPWLSALPRVDWGTTGNGLGRMVQKNAPVFRGCLTAIGTKNSAAWDQSL